MGSGINFSLVHINLEKARQLPNSVHKTKMNPPSENTMTTQLETLLCKNKENMRKEMEKTLRHMQDKLEKDMESLKEQHQIETKHLAQQH